MQRKELPECDDAFAARVKSDYDWAALDAKLKEGVQQDADEKLKVKTHQALEKALVANLPEEFEVPETLVENVSKERFASMLANMREQGSTDEQLKELITEENYKVQADLAQSRRQRDQGQHRRPRRRTATGPRRPQSEVDDEVMTIQAQTLQRGEKFRESEVRPRRAAARDEHDPLVDGVARERNRRRPQGGRCDGCPRDLAGGARGDYQGGGGRERAVRERNS